MAYRRSLRGFSIVELLVSVAIGLVVTLAVFGVLAASEGRKRTSTSMNDVNQSGAYVAYTIDRVVRSAGTGYVHGWSRVGGCRLNATASGTTTLPSPDAFPTPFTAVPQTLRLAPVVIFQGASDTGSDVLMVMSGSAGFSESPVLASSVSGTPAQLQLPNTIGFRRNDLVFLSEGGECVLSQIYRDADTCNPGSTPTGCNLPLQLEGDYAAASLAALDTASEVNVFSIGTTPPLDDPDAPENRPQFMLFGVGDNSTLFSYDLLLPVNGAYAPIPVAEGVHQLHAVYGIDANDDGVLDTWQAPVADSGWDGPTLMDGSVISNDRLRQIVALRIGFVMRSALVEREIEPGVPVAPESLLLFRDLPEAAQVTVDLSDPAEENRNQRHRSIEITVPVRNLLMRTNS